jgi:KAP family P-loop domain
MPDQPINTESNPQVSSSGSPRTLELPDSSVAVDEEFAAIWRTAEVIGALSTDDYRWSFTSILLALLYSEQDISQWFLSYAQAANIHLAEISNKRAFVPGNLPHMREEFAKGGSFLKKSAFTSSTLNLFRGAVDLLKSSAVTIPSPMGARHLMGAFVYRLPSGHLDDLQKWGFVPGDWSEKFVQYMALRNPQELFWTSLHQQLYGGRAPVSSSDAAPPVKEETSRAVTPDGQADLSESEAAGAVSQRFIPPIFVPLRADFTGDNIPLDPSKNDHLDFKRDVRAFASVIASEDLTPPMSIGIFGDWGSGKSFFMRQLEQKIKFLAGTDPAYCSHVVTVWFNAWHYVDQNLWATLVTEIFDKLFAYIRADRQEDAEARLKTIEEELSKEQGLHTEAKADLVKAETDRETAEIELKKLRQIRKEKENTLSVQLNDVAQLVIGSPEVKAKLDDVERDLGLPVLDSSYDAFEAQVKQMRSLGTRALAILVGAFREPGWIRRIGLLLVVFGLPCLVAFLMGKYAPPVLHTPAQLIAGGVTLLVSATVWMRSVYVAGSAVVSKAETTLTQLKAIRERRAAQQESESIGEIEVLRAREEAARQKLKDAEARIQELKIEAQELQPGRRLQRFIEQRFEAGDYRQHLGLVSLIRRDFETLSRLLRERKDLPVDRIVLFIDDLDRCPPERVCEVLEAIHLILAFELFVVVVGVDVRWVAKSLQKRYSGLLTGGISSAGLGREDLASPEDYLEKIFQVPFWINPLQAVGSRALVAAMLAKYPARTGGMLGKGADVKPTTSTPSDDTASEASSPAAQAAAPSPVAPDSGVPAQEVGRSDTPEAQSHKENASPRDDDGKSAPITLTGGEQKFILELSQFGGTSPRRLKRFINLYRVIKSTLSESEVNTFLNSSGEDGDYKLVLVLLAVLTGSPSLSSEILRKLQQPGSALKTVLQEFNKDTREEHRSCLGAFAHLQSRYEDSRSSATLRQWAAVVARYSFRP